jgi:two-component system response regulator YesN
VVGEAEDGEIALQKAIEIKPDLLLLDICMPFLNGLELVEKLKEELNDPVIIIISGYDEFKYAQLALKLKVFDYILKPIDKDALRQTLFKAREEINQKEIKEERYNFQSIQLKKSNNYLKENFMKDWLNSKLSKEEINSQIKYFNIDHTNTMGIIIVKIIDKSMSLIENKWQIDLLCYAIENISKEIMGKFQYLNVFTDTKNQVVLISDISPITEWNKISSTLIKDITKYLKRDCIVVSEILSDELNNISKVYKELCTKLVEESQKTPVVLTVQKYIDSSYSDPDLSLTEIAEKIGISQTYLSRLFKQELGMSFIDYLTQVRIKNSVVFMRDPSIKIYEIAELVGYSTQHYFCNVFKKQLGISPAEYKKGGIYGKK